MKQKLHASVNNSGNILFQGSVIKQIASDQLLDNYGDLREHAGTVVLTMANFIREEEDPGLDAFIDHLESSKIERVILIGVGAQAHTYDNNFKISTTASRLLRIASERSASIGVRGYYTAELLSERGYKNIDVIGCPSIFYHLDPAFQVHKKVAEPSLLSINATPVGHFRDKVADLFDFAIKYDAEYVLQNETHLLFNDDASDRDERHFDYFVSYYCHDSNDTAIRGNWFKGRSKIFFSIESWLSYCASRDFFIGSRIHGNVAAALSGVPSLTLYFDSRTRELAEFLGLPNMSLDDFNPDHDLKYYFDIADFSAFNRRFGSLYSNYVGFLEKNGLSHRLPALHNNKPILTHDFPNAISSGLTISDRAKLKSLIDFSSSLKKEQLTKPEMNELLARLRSARAAETREKAERKIPLGALAPSLWLE
jgi:Polysaccharide pyruvyl transferase